jgi:phosphatidate cytidylyltransferase
VLKSNLALRLATAAVVVPLLLALLFLAPAWGFFVLIAVASAICALEVFRMTHPGDLVSQVLGVLTTLGVASALYIAGGDARVLVTLLIGVPLLGMMIALFRFGDIPSAGLRVMGGAVAPLYVGVPLAMLAMMRRDFPDGAGYVLLTLMFGWFADTGGYFFGRYLGKAKLYEAVSPKKTREGFVGALVGAVIGGLVAHFWYLPRLPLVSAIVLGVAGGALGQFGDLIESLLKRSTGVKDSGNIVPGHGGLMDRVDALLVVAPVVYLYSVWTG